MSLLILLGALLCASGGPATEAPAAQNDPTLQTALDRLPRLGTIIYTTAHPDDESGTVITYLARGLHMRVVLIAMTRGEGGQNSQGSELSEELAWVRTHELQEAVAHYGAEVRFIGAPDFGYSKSVEETLRIWDKEKILADLVRYIRELKPVAILSGFTGTARDGGGSHHQAAGMLTRQAFEAAADPNAYPEDFSRGLVPWQTRYLLVRGRGGEAEPAVEIPVDKPSPVPGKTYAQLGWEGFRSHRSQGMGGIDPSRFRGRGRSLQRVVATAPADLAPPAAAEDLAPYLASLPDLFPSLGFLKDWRNRLAHATALAGESRQAWQAGYAGDAALKLVQGAGLLADLRREFAKQQENNWEARRARAWVAEKEAEFLRAAARVAGVEVEALTDRATVCPGERVWVGLALRTADPASLREAGLELENVQVVAPEDWPVQPLTAENTPAERRVEFVVHIPENADTQNLPMPALRARGLLRAGDLQAEILVPVRGLAQTTERRESDLQQFDPRRLLRLGRAEEEIVRARLEPVTVAPALTLTVQPELRLLAARAGETTREFAVRLQAHKSFGKCSAWFNVPSGWYSPVPQEVELNEPGAVATLHFAVTLPAGIRPGSYNLEAVAGRGEEKYSLSRREVPNFAPPEQPVPLPTILYQPARVRLEVIDVDVPPGLRIGYIGFPDDPVPELLAGLGIGVDLLDEAVLADAELSLYDTVVISNRVYDARTDLVEQTPRLLDYVKNGGVLLVEHQGRRWDPARFAPYPAQKSSNLRVTDETASVRVLTPNHPVLNFPSRIGPDDWKNWVQERGLYFWESWPQEYTAMLEMADPNQKPQRGSLLYARYGKGAYIYCGLALFRQVRAGVHGGVRLYVNLLTQGRALPTQ